MESEAEEGEPMVTTVREAGESDLAKFSIAAIVKDSGGWEELPLDRSTT